VRHCPECRLPFAPQRDVCPECWTRLASGPPPERRLSLVIETRAFYEADLLETALREEGIPCLRLPAHGALPWSIAGIPALAGARLYVHPEMTAAAREVVFEVLGGRETEA
jgi:hypothetical protein